MPRIAQVDVWRTDVPLANRQLTKADILELLPNHHMDIQYRERGRNETTEVRYTPLQDRVRLAEKPLIERVLIMVERPGELVPSIPAYFWLDGDGLRIAIGRTVLAIDLKDD